MVPDSEMAAKVLEELINTPGIPEDVKNLIKNIDKTKGFDLSDTGRPPEQVVADLGLAYEAIRVVGLRYTDPNHASISLEQRKAYLDVFLAVSAVIILTLQPKLLQFVIMMLSNDAKLLFLELCVEREKKMLAAGESIPINERSPEVVAKIEQLKETISKSEQTLKEHNKQNTKTTNPTTNQEPTLLGKSRILSSALITLATRPKNLETTFHQYAAPNENIISAILAGVATMIVSTVDEEFSAHMNRLTSKASQAIERLINLECLKVVQEAMTVEAGMSKSDIEKVKKTIAEEESEMLSAKTGFTPPVSDTIGNVVDHLARMIMQKQGKKKQDEFLN